MFITLFFIPPALVEWLAALNALTAVKAKLSEPQRVERLAAMDQLYAAGDEPGLKKLGKSKALDLFDRIIGQLARNWRNETFSTLQAGYRMRPFDLNRIVPENYVIPDDTTAQMLVDNLKLDFDLPSLYEDTCSNNRKTFAAAIRSNLSPSMWISFLRKIHAKDLPLPEAVAEHLPKLSAATITAIIEALSADKSARHRVASLKVILAIKKGKHRSLFKKFASKFSKPSPRDFEEESELKAELAG